jgi:PKD repeat protein
MFSRFSFIIALLLLPFGGKAVCSGSFTYSANGLTVTFSGTTNPVASPNTFYYWWFSDQGNYATTQNAVYTFSAPGTYMVCFSFNDAVNQCSDSVCQSVTVGGCNADFTSYDSLGSFSFMSTTTAGPGAQYYWDFGDGNYSTQANPYYYYANPGVYTVCLTVYDSLQNFCDSTCHNVTVQSSGGCNATFTSLDSMGYVFFLSSTTAGSGAMYFWDFGDGNYSNAANPSHVYTNPGMYLICLTVYDSLQNFCDSVCYTVQVSATAIEESALQNSFSAAPNPADGSLTLSYFTASSGNVEITFYDAAGRIADTKSVAVQGAGKNSTEINTNTMAQGIYLVKIGIDGTEAWTRVAITHQSRQ